MARCRLVALALVGSAVSALGAPVSVFDRRTRAVNTWRTEAAEHLALSPGKAAALREAAAAPAVARCVKLNNYWCIKAAGWDGEIAADGEGHVAFASAVEGAAVAALLLKRYYVDFDRKTALAIVSRWAPAQCGAFGLSAPRPVKALAPKGLANTLRARWLAGHARGFAAPVSAHAAKPRHSVVADHIAPMMPAPTIAVGLGEAKRPMTLDALLMSSPNAPASRSMLGLPRTGDTIPGSLGACGSDSGRIASYAAKAAEGMLPGPDGDLGLFDTAGTPTPALAALMANMARVEIGPDAPAPALIDAGIAAAFKPGRNPRTGDTKDTNDGDDRVTDANARRPGR